MMVPTCFLMVGNLLVQPTCAILIMTYSQLNQDFAGFDIFFCLHDLFWQFLIFDLLCIFLVIRDLEIVRLTRVALSSVVLEYAVQSCIPLLYQDQLILDAYIL